MTFWIESLFAIFVHHPDIRGFPLQRKERPLGVLIELLFDLSAQLPACAALVLFLTYCSRHTGDRCLSSGAAHLTSFL